MITTLLLSVVWLLHEYQDCNDRYDNIYLPRDLTETSIPLI